MEWEYKKWELLTGKHTIILVVATVPISATFYCAGECEIQVRDTGARRSSSKHLARAIRLHGWARATLRLWIQGCPEVHGVADPVKISQHCTLSYCKLRPAEILERHCFRQRAKRHDIPL